MVIPEKLVEILSANGISFFTGVPDSLLSPLTAQFEKLEPVSHVRAVNEGSAIGIAIGYHLSTGKVPCIYLQNSGLGNAVNPIASLVHKEIYNIPMLLLIGWRGQPGVKDEPQHLKQGAITLEQLQLLDIPYELLTPHTDAKSAIAKLLHNNGEKNQTMALVFAPNSISKKQANKMRLKSTIKASEMSREYAIACILECLSKDDLIISTTGKCSRELNELCKNQTVSPATFLTVGGMGHASSIALGAAMFTEKKVICLDGDGALLMHLGSLANISQIQPKNLTHILLNNGTHESVGGQPSLAEAVDFQKVATACKYANVARATNREELIKEVHKALKSGCTSFIEVNITSSSRSNLGRPEETPEANKNDVMLRLGTRV